MNFLIILVLLCSVDSVFADTTSKTKQKISKTKITKKSSKVKKKATKKKAKDTVSIKKPKPAFVPTFSVNQAASKLNASSHKNYDKFHQEFKESLNRLSGVLPNCAKKGMLQECSKKMFETRQWIDAYSKNVKIQKCKDSKLKSDLNTLNKMIVTKFLVAERYPDEIVRKLASANSEYYSEVNDKIRAVTTKLPSCF